MNYPLIDYAKEINASRKAEQRRRAIAWLGISSGMIVGGVGLGSLLALSGVWHGLLLLVALAWFAWSVTVLRGRE